MTEIIVTDKLGRQLEIRRPTPSDQFDLLEAAGANADYNQWFSLAALVFACKSIDGVPMPTPRKPEDFKKNAAMLQEAGLNALGDYFRQQAETAEAAQSAELETAKN